MTILKIKFIHGHAYGDLYIHYTHNRTICIPHIHTSICQFNLSFYLMLHKKSWNGLNPQLCYKSQTKKLLIVGGFFHGHPWKKVFKVIIIFLRYWALTHTYNPEAMIWIDFIMPFVMLKSTATPKFLHNYKRLYKCFTTVVPILMSMT